MVGHDAVGDPVRAPILVTVLLGAAALGAASDCARAGVVQTAGAAAEAAPQPAETVLEGDLEVLVEDSAGTSRTVYFLIAGSQRIELRFTAVPPAFITGTPVRVRGRWDGAAFVVSSMERRS
jgi:hypothetical protein